MKFKKLLFLLVITCGVIIGPRVNAQAISGNTYFYDQQFNVSYGSFPAWSNGFGESGVYPTSTYHTIAKSVNGPYINTVRDVYVSNTTYNFTSGNSYRLTLVFNKGSYLLPQSSALYGLTNNRNLSLCRLYGQSTGNMTCSISWSDSDESMVATIYLHTSLSGNGFELHIGNLNAGTNCFVYNSSFDYSQGLKLTSADIIQDNSATDSLINNQNNNTQNIINNNNQNSQIIINNQNENTEREIESQKVCKTRDVITSRSVINANGISQIRFNGSNGSDYLFPSGDYTIEFDSTGVTNSSFYIRLETDSSSTNLGLVSPINFTANTNFRLWVYSTSKNFNDFPNFLNSIKLLTYYCENGNQALSDDINDLKDVFTDAELPDVISGGGGGTYFDDINASSDTPISDLLLLPINLLLDLKENLSGSCTSYTIPFDFTGGNKTLTFPCLNLEDHLGSNIWTIIDGLFCIFMLYNIFNLIVFFYDSWSSASDTFFFMFNPPREPGQQIFDTKFF